MNMVVTAMLRIHFGDRIYGIQLSPSAELLSKAPLTFIESIFRAISHSIQFLRGTACVELGGGT